MKIIRYFIQALIIYFLFLLSKVLGLEFSRKFFKLFFNLLGPLIRSNKIALKNLSKINPSLSKKKLNENLKSMWSNYGMTFAEYMHLDKIKNNSSKYISLKGTNILSQIIKKNKPVIFISGHFANFEIMSLELARRNLKLATIYRPLNNPFLNPLMEYLRVKYICKNQIKKGFGGVRDTIRYINQKHNIALMVDQRLSEGIKIPFFNFDAFTTTLPAQIALKHNYDIIPIFLKRDKKNNFIMELLNPIKISNFKNNNVKKKITLNINKILEKMIKKEPGNWILTHNRWK